MDELAVIHRRLRAQRLTAKPLGSPGEVVGWLGAMQAQEYAEAKWSIAERIGGGCTDRDVEDAFDRGEILRTHALRPTWHFLTPDDIRWVLALTAPRVKRQMGYYDRDLELTRDVLARGCEIVASALADGEPRMRRELAEPLQRGGIDASDARRLGQICMHAELEAVICSGPRRGKQHTYALIADRAPDAREISRDEALAELSLRYFRSHGPARIKDLCAWASLTVADATAGVAAVEPSLAIETDDAGTRWFSALGEEPPARSGCFLVPTYDEMGMGYQKDLRMVPAAQPPRGGVPQRTIVIDGTTVGGWRRTLDRSSVTVEATPLVTLDRRQARELEGAVERFGRFLGLPASLVTVAPA